MSRGDAERRPAGHGTALNQLGTAATPDTSDDGPGLSRHGRFPAPGSLFTGNREKVDWTAGSRNSAITENPLDAARSLSPAVAAAPTELAVVVTRRAVEDALHEALPIYWRRRADMFEWARPRPGDWPGRASASDIAARDHRLADAAEACRHAAVVAELGRPDWIAAVTREAA